MSEEFAKRDDLLAKQITEMRNTLSTDRLDMSYGELISLYQREELIINPDFQRLFRWDEGKRTRFIESLLLGIPIPPIFVAEDNDGKWELVDGLQRISTILSFFGILKGDNDKNNWVMESGDLISSLEGYRGNTLPIKYKRNLERTYCRVEIIKWDSQYDMRYELFNRLNTGGEPLTQQEIRNCIFRGRTSEFNDLIKEYANREAFLSALALTKHQEEELYNEELILRFIALYFGDEDWKKTSNMSLFMTQFMKEAIEEESFNYEEGRDTLDCLMALIQYTNPGDYKFSNNQFSTSLFDAIAIGLVRYKDIYFASMNLIKKNIELLKSSEEFRKYTGSAASSKSRVKKRLEIAMEIMSNEEL